MAKKLEKKQIPEHLQRAPMDSFTSSPSRGGGSPSRRPKSALTGKGGRGKGGKDTSGKKHEGESKRIKRAEANRKALFHEIKRLIDKAEETANAPGGLPDTTIVVPNFPETNLTDVKIAIRDRRLLRFLCGPLVNNRHVQVLLLRHEFSNFVKALLGQSSPSHSFFQGAASAPPQAVKSDLVLSEAELGDLFLHLCKRLESALHLAEQQQALL